MTWSVVEEFAESKFNDRVCEDLIVVTEQFAAVIDGASDATGALFNGLSGGRFTAEIVADSIQTQDSRTTAAEFAGQVTAALQQAVSEATDGTPTERWPAASVVCVSFERDEVWRIGDCSFSIDGHVDKGGKRVDDAAYSFRAAVNASLIESGTPLEEILRTDPGSAAARPLFDVQQHVSNRPGPWGYGCINGRPVPDEFIEVVAIAGATEVILASDGYPDLRPTLDETEAALRANLSADPAAIGDFWHVGKSLRPGANSMDDRAYLRLVRS